PAHPGRSAPRLGPRQRLQAPDRARGPGRRGPRPGRPRRARRAGGGDGAPPARPHRRLRLRRRRDGRGRRRPAHLLQHRFRGARRARRGRHRGGLPRLDGADGRGRAGPRRRRAGGVAGRRLPRLGPGPAGRRPRAARPHPDPRAAVARGAQRPVPVAGRDPARLRAPEAQRLGARIRDPRPQGAALDRQRLLPGDLRPLRPVRFLPVGGPGRLAHRRLPRRAALRPRARADLARAHRHAAGALRRRRAMTCLDLLDGFGFEAAAIVLVPEGERARRGDVGRNRPWRSVTKTLTGFGATLAPHEGSSVFEHQPVPPGSALRHLHSHASRYYYESDSTLQAPGLRRHYSNYGIDEAARHVERRLGSDVGDWIREQIAEPLGMDGLEWSGSPSVGAHGALTDLALFAAELLRPTLLEQRWWAEMTGVQFPELVGIMPGFGKQSPNPFGLGIEVRGTKSPHWT